MIDETSAIASSIATSVEGQTGTTQETAGNKTQATLGLQEVTENNEHNADI